MKRIVLTGGGSAGHVTPNLALVPFLQEKGLEVSYIGTNAIEKEMVKAIPFYEISAGKLRRYLSKENISDFFKVFKGYRQSKKILKQLKPDIVFSKGGYVSVPVVYAAKKLKILVVIHESDYTQGFSNKLCGKKADKICLSFQPKSLKSNEVYTGSPIRNEILQGSKVKAQEFLMFKEAKKTLLIMGGSLGAQALNLAVDESIEELTQIYNVVHLRGKDKLNAQINNEGYRQYEFLENIEDIYAITDFIVCRSGANSVFEITKLQIPAIYVPLPLSASRGDQILNAQYCKEKGYALLLEQENLTPQNLLKELEALRANKDAFKQAMANSVDADGTQNVLNVIYDCLDID